MKEYRLLDRGEKIIDGDEWSSKNGSRPHSWNNCSGSVGGLYDGYYAENFYMRREVVEVEISLPKEIECGRWKLA